ncbi:unnamed protein product, partial [Bubo scandiacus]
TGSQLALLFTVERLGILIPILKQVKTCLDQHGRMPCQSHGSGEITLSRRSFPPSTALAKVSSWLLKSQWEGQEKGDGCTQHSDLPVTPHEWTACGHIIFTCELTCL